MALTPELVISAVGGDELEAYVPNPKYWVLRDLLHTAPTSMPAEHKGKNKLVVVRIEFRNSSEEPLELEFENSACNAELLNLEVYDDLGTPIPPVKRMHIRPRDNAKSFNVIPTKGKHVYDLVGEIVEGWLVFPGAKYQIPRSETLSIVFKYKKHISNTLSLNLQDS